MLFIFFHITSWHRAARSLTYGNFIVIQPNSHTHALSAFLSQSPRGTGQNPLHTALSVPLFLIPPRGIRLPTLSDRDQFFFPTPRGTEQKSSTHCSTRPRPNFCLHATSWHRANVLNTLLYRSSTEFFTFSTPLRGTEQNTVTHHSVGSRPKPLFLKWKFTPLHGTKQKVHALPKLCNRSSTETNNSSNSLIFQTSKKKQA